MFNNFCKKETQSQNLLLNIFLVQIYGGNEPDHIKTFARECLKIENTDKVTSFDKIDIKVLGQFIKKEYPYIWNFIWQHYEKDFFIKQIKQVGFTIKNCYNHIKEVVYEMIKPMFSALVIYWFMLILTA